MMDSAAVKKLLEDTKKNFLETLAGFSSGNNFEDNLPFRNKVLRFAEELHGVRRRPEFDFKIRKE